MPVTANNDSPTAIIAVAGSWTKSNVSGSASSVTLLNANPIRIKWKVTNDSTAVMYIDESGGTASATSYTVSLGPNDYYESQERSTGAITAIWASATGTARVGELA